MNCPTGKIVKRQLSFARIGTAVRVVMCRSPSIFVILVGNEKFGMGTLSGVFEEYVHGFEVRLVTF